MKKNNKIIKALLQIYFLCPTILNHVSKRRPQAQSLLKIQNKNKTGNCQNSTIQQKNTCSHKISTSKKK